MEDEHPGDFGQRLLDAAVERWGRDAVLEGVRKVLALGVLLGPPAQWITNREAESPVWFLVDPLLDDLEVEDAFTLVYLAEFEPTDFKQALDGALREGQGLVVLETDLEALAHSSLPAHHGLHGIRHLRAGEHLDAWPPLIIGLEGLVRAYAVEHDTDFSDAGGVEKVAKGLQLPPYFERFFVRHVFGGTGHPFRHGFAATGFEEKSVALAVAASGWLDFYGQKASLQALATDLVASAALTSALEAHRDEATAFFQQLVLKRLNKLEPSAVEGVFRAAGLDDGSLDAA